MRNGLRMIRALAVTATVSLAAVQAIGAPPALHYQVVAVPLSGNGTGYGINGAGQITGTMAVSSCTPGTSCQTNDAFTYDPSTGIVTDLGTLDGLNATGYAINDSGAVAGELDNFSGNSTTVPESAAFLYSGGTMTLLADVADPNTGARAINSAGLVVGFARPSTGAAIPAIWSGGNVSGVPNAAAARFTGATGVNDYGQVAGGLFIFNYPNGLAIPFTTEYAAGINNAGQTVGAAQGSRSSAYIYSVGAVRVLPDLYPFPTSDGQAANGINNAGQVVGSSFVYNGTTASPGKAFLFDNSAITDLNTVLVNPPAGLVLQSAVAINDSGWILADGYSSANFACPCVFILEPVTPFAPRLNVYATPAQAAAGTPVTISWNDQSVTSCTGSGGASGDGWGGSVPANGGQQTVTETTSGLHSYTITCAYAGGSVQSTATVNGATTPSVTFSAASAAVTTGEQISLSWSSVGMTACTGTGGSSTDSWNGTHPVSGNLSTAEGVPGTYTYQLTCSNGAQIINQTASVTVTYPALSVTINASPTSITAGGSTTLTWSSANAVSCIASGGSSDDSWPGTNEPTSGSVKVAEPFALASSLTITYTLTCTNPTTNQTTAASVNVVDSPAGTSTGGGGSSSSSHHGGGAIDAEALLLLAGLAGLRSTGRRPRPRRQR